MNCRACGNKIAESNKFCTKCGVSIECKILITQEKDDGGNSFGLILLVLIIIVTIAAGIVASF